MRLIKIPVFLLSCASPLVLPNAVQAKDAAGNTLANAAIETLQDSLDIIIPDSIKREGVRVRIGAGFGMLPDYSGADSYRYSVVPLVDVRFGDKWRLTNRRLSFDAIVAGDWRFGPFAKHTSGRRESRSAVLEGLGDINDTIQVGLFARYRTNRMLFRTEYRHSLGASQGDSVRLTFGHGIFQKGRFAAAAVASAKWQSGKAMRTHFGISETQSTNSVAGFETYRPGASISEVSMSLYGRYKLDDRTRLLGLASFGRLTGGAADSPIVANGVGSANQLKIGVGFTVDF